MTCGLRFAGMLCCSTALFAQAPPASASGARDLVVTVGKSVVVDSPVNIERVAVANGDVAEAVATTPREVLVNGKSQGDTTLIIWQQGGNRLFFDLTVRPNRARLDAIRRELESELPNQKVTFDLQGDTVFVNGTVSDLTAASRALQIVSTLGKPVNLLRVSVPPIETQILIKVRFANVDRSTSRELGINFFSTGAGNTVGSITTGTFKPPQPGSSAGGSGGATFSLTDALNVFFFRSDLDLGATIRALQAKSLLEVLAEPNVLAINGKSASFLAGGEFPFPTLQGGGGGLGAVTIQFREFGVRIQFTPVVTPRGSIRMTITPEVSALDYANALQFQGFTIPALSTRRVETEVELESGQSFAIGGLLDNRVTESLARIPGLGDIPFFGKLFRSQQLTKNNSELLVFVTPEVVQPMPQGYPLPGLHYPKEFLPPNSDIAMNTPSIDKSGAAPAKPEPPAIPMEDLMRSLKPVAQQQSGGQPAQLQFVPMLIHPDSNQPAATQAPASPPQSSPAAPQTAPRR